MLVNIFCKGGQEKTILIYLKEAEAVYKALPASKHGWPEGHHQDRSWGDGQRDCVLDEGLGCQESGGWKKCFLVKKHDDLKPKLRVSIIKLVFTIKIVHVEWI